MGTRIFRAFLGAIYPSARSLTFHCGDSELWDVGWDGRGSSGLSKPALYWEPSLCTRSAWLSASPAREQSIWREAL